MVSDHWIAGRKKPHHAIVPVFQNVNFISLIMRIGAPRVAIIRDGEPNDHHNVAFLWADLPHRHTLSLTLQPIEVVSSISTEMYLRNAPIRADHVLWEIVRWHASLIKQPSSTTPSLPRPLREHYWSGRQCFKPIIPVLICVFPFSRIPLASHSHTVVLTILCYY